MPISSELGTRARRVGATALAFALLAASAAQADEYTTGFEPPAFQPGDLDGQAGWTKPRPNLDIDIFDHSGLPSAGLGLGSQSLRVSNSDTTGGLTGAQSPELADEAGEAEADSAGQSGGNRQSRWEASATFAALRPDEQPGLQVDFSPNRGDGQRMSLARVKDTPAGLSVTVFDVTDNGPGQVVAFPETIVASGLDRTVAHSLAFTVDYVDGPTNDLVRVYVDGALVHTGGTWEQYYRNDPTQAPGGNDVPTTDELLIAVRDAAVPGVDGEGLFVDNVWMRSSTPVVTPPPSGSVTPPPPAPAAIPPLTGTPGADNITGSPGNDRIAAGGGNDNVNGGAGSDYLLGETGDDRLFGAEGNDSLNGGSGKDRLAGGEGNDRLNGDTGNDLFFGGTGNDRMTGGSGNDRLFGDTGNDRFSGGSGNDNFSGGAGDDVIDGGAGDDLLSGNGGRDTIRGGSGDDRIKVRGGGRDTVSCGPGQDSVSADSSDRVSRDCERVRRG